MSDQPPETVPESGVVLSAQFLRELFEKLLTSSTLVHLWVHYEPGIELPKELMTDEFKEGKAGVYMEYGLDMPVPIHDLTINNEGVSATLSFTRRPCFTHIPWSSVLMIAHEGQRAPAPPPKQRPKLTLVP